MIGAFAGFFLAGTLNAMEFFAEPAGQRNPGGTQSNARFILSIVLGAVGGGLIGRLLPLRQPLLQKPSDPRREKVVGCAVAIGLFGGFLAGGVTGAVLGEMLGLGMDDGPRRATLFFGGMGVGTLGGPIVLGVTTNYVYQWLVGRSLRRP